ncbi:MAG TPA: ABC transporter permease [Bryobacteraceae bacterium]|jgi:predicted permease|nr:ABC transporter permease [Bryobacteraceae bacterium]
MNSIVQRLNRRLRYFLQRRERQRLLEEEMKFHIESVVEDLKAQGMPEADARTTARRRFGNISQKSEESRATWISLWISDAAQDMFYAFRTLRRDVGFAAFVILTVGLGIGASTTVFSVVRAVLLRPLPFSDPNRLVWIANTDVDDEGLSGQTVPVDHFLDLRNQSQSFSDLAAYSPFYRFGDNKLTGDGEPLRLTSVAVSHNFFSILGVKPLLGKTFTAADCQFNWNAPKVVLLSYGLWQRRFDSDRRVIGRLLTLNDAAVTVIGVMPPSFDFATVFAPASRVDLFLPYPLTEEANSRGNELAMIGRLKPGSTLQSARAEMQVLGPRIQRRDPDRNFIPIVSTLADHVSVRLRPALLALAFAVAMVMLIVCANLSNLLLARMAARQKEMAIRASLGARRLRLIRQTLTESIVLSSCGAAIGFVLAIGGTRAITHLTTLDIPLRAGVRVDFGALAFTVASAVLTGLIFGLIPALQVPAAALHESLKNAARGSSHSKNHTWIRSSLVVSEIAFACLLLAGSGLLIRSFVRLLDTKIGFEPEDATVLRVDPSSRYSSQAQRIAYFNEVLCSIRGVPGIEAAGLTDVLPLGGDRTWAARAKGRTYTKNHPPPWAFVRIASDGYLKAMGISLLAGRDFTAHDNASDKPVIVINETLARTLWPGQNPIGQVLAGAGYVDREVIGVVSDVRHLALEQASGCEMYLPIRQSRDYSAVDLVFRSALSSAELAAPLRRALAAIDPTLPANDFQPMQQMVDKAISPRRFVVLMLTGFSGFALVLAALGIYGVIQYSVTQRTQEIGIRMALGATAAHLQASILRQTLALAAMGVALGLFASGESFEQ